MQVVANTLAPYVAHGIGQQFGHGEDKNKAAQLVSHAILGAAVAATGGNNALSAGIAACGSEAAAPLLVEYLYGKKAKDLTASQKNYSSSS